VHCLANRAEVACPIRKAVALTLGVMRSVRLVLETAICHFSATPSFNKSKEDARG